MFLTFSLGTFKETRVGGSNNATTSAAVIVEETTRLELETPVTTTEGPTTSVVGIRVSLLSLKACKSLGKLLLPLLKRFLQHR